MSENYFYIHKQTKINFYNIEQTAIKNKFE